MANILGDNDLLLMLERVIKSGIISTVLRTENEQGEAVENELIIDYTVDPKAPVLKVKRDDEWKIIRTESDVLFREFKSKVLQMGTGDSGDGYSPSVFFKLHNDTRDDTKFSPEVISKFYRDYKTDTALRPFLHHVNLNGSVKKLYPFMDSGHVYLDISEVISSDTEDIKSIGVVLSELWTRFDTLCSNIELTVNSMNEKLASIKTDLKAEDDSRDKLISDISKSTTKNTNDIANLKSQVLDIVESMDVKILSKDLKITHPDGVRVVPVVFNYTNGNNSMANGVKDLMNGSIYISSSSLEQIVKIGNELLVHGGAFSNSTEQLEWTLSQTRATPTTKIYDVVQLSSSSFLVYLRTGDYIVQSKYLDMLTITPYPNGYGGFPIRYNNNVINSNVNRSNLKSKAFYSKYISGMIVTKGIYVNDWKIELN